MRQSEIVHFKELNKNMTSDSSLTTANLAFLTHINITKLDIQTYLQRASSDHNERKNVSNKQTTVLDIT